MGAFKHIDLNIADFMQLINAYAAAVSRVHECNLKNDDHGAELMRGIAADNHKKIRAIAAELFTKCEVQNA